MKKIAILSLLTLLSAMSVAAQNLKTGEAIITAMHDKYAGKWYKTLTFKQETVNYKPDGTSSSEIWYEAMTVPGKLRIDIEPTDKQNGILFANGQLFQFKDGKHSGAHPFVHPLLVLGFDVYGQPVETTIKQVKDMGIDLSVVHKEKWMGRDTYVVGAAQGDLTKPQVWIDTQRLYFVRLFQLAGKDKKIVAETQFNKYEKAKGGWVAAEVVFNRDGKLATKEIYSEIRADVKLPEDLWDADKWTTVDRSYMTGGKKPN